MHGHRKIVVQTYMMMSKRWERQLRPPGRSFFLFGPRGTGKSTWIRKHFPQALTIDLLHSETYLELARHPENLRAMAANGPTGSWVCIDEVQKLPQILDEVHALIEERGLRFALTGSSARKLRRGGANLLGGRAVTAEMTSLSASELGEDFQLDRFLEFGGLPLVAQDPADAREILSAYVHTYLKEEIQAEQLVRKVEPFSRFLEVAGTLNGQVVSASNVARDAGVPRASVDSYFSILQDTLLGRMLRAYHPGARVREAAHPKFYWFDPGVARACAGMLRDKPDRSELGFSFETWVLHELDVYNHTRGIGAPIYYYRTGAGVEVDFVVETRRKTASRKAENVLIEVKLAERWDRRWETAARALAASGSVKVKGMIGVYTGKTRYDFDGFCVLPASEFVQRLFAGDLF
jgi:predicted AAA+ superfamily ATPase